MPRKLAVAESEETSGGKGLFPYCHLPTHQHSMLLILCIIKGRGSILRSEWDKQ